MLYDSGFRPSSFVLGAQVISIAPNFATFIQGAAGNTSPMPTAGMNPAQAAPRVIPIAPVITPINAVVGEAPTAPVPTKSMSTLSTIGWLAVGGLTIGGIVLLLSAVSSKR